VDPVPDPLLYIRSAGNRTRASGSVAKNSDNYTTETALTRKSKQKAKKVYRGHGSKA
jgi:hypothetical protein